MAKKKGNRILIGLEDSQSKKRVYITSKNRVNDPEKFSIKKYNPKTRTHTVFKEVQKLK